jgi:hypothetical protein
MSAAAEARERGGRARKGGRREVVVCSIMEYHDVASKHCECVHFANRQGVVMRMKLSCMKMNEIRKKTVLGSKNKTPRALERHLERPGDDIIVFGHRCHHYKTD